MASCSLPPKSISLTVESIPTRFNKLSNFTVDRDVDPEWIGSWMIYYLFLLTLFKKYNHTTSIYVDQFNAYNNMKIDLDYVLMSRMRWDDVGRGYYFYKDIQNSPRLQGNPYYLQGSVAAYVNYIIDCINKDCDLFIIPIHLNYTVDVESLKHTYIPGKRTTHKNVLIYKRCLNAFEHFEPYGNYFFSPDVDWDVKRCLQKLVNHINRKTGRKIKFHDNYRTSLNGNIPGPQSLEMITPKFTTFERNQGYCVAWSLLFIELSLKYPNLSIKNINQHVMDEVVEAITTRGGIPNTTNTELFSDRYLYLARNYSFYIIAQIELKYHFLFDEMIRNTNTMNKLVKQTAKLYHNTEYVNYLSIINGLYSIEKHNMENGTTYEEYLAVLVQDYKEDYGATGLKGILKAPIMSIAKIDNEDSVKLSYLVSMSLLARLSEQPKTTTYTVHVRSTVKTKTSKSKTRKKGSRYHVLQNSNENSP